MIETQVRQARRIDMDLATDPAVWLVNKSVLEVVDANRAGCAKIPCSAEIIPCSVEQGICLLRPMPTTLAPLMVFQFSRRPHSGSVNEDSIPVFLCFNFLTQRGEVRRGHNGNP